MPTPTRSPLPSMVVAGQLTPPPGSIYLGAFPNPYGLPRGVSTDSLSYFESLIGRRLAIVNHYLPFGQDLASKSIFDDYTNYRVPMISFTCQASDFQIASGAYDTTIHQIATELKAFRWPMFFRYMYDPNLGAGNVQTCHDEHDKDNGQYDPAQFIAGWRHFHDLMVGDGVTNVVWVFSVSAAQYAYEPTQYYPGDSYVDWVSFDTYDPHDLGFVQSLTKEYDRLSPYNKPIMVSEIGEGLAGQTVFFNNAVSTLQTQFPQIKAFVYYESIGYLPNYNYDYRITSTALPAFNAFANDPYMSAMYGK